MTRVRIQLDTANKRINVTDDKNTECITKDLDGAQKLFINWSDAYRAAIETPNPQQQLLDIGNEIYNWLDARTGRTTRWLQTPSAPFFIEFLTPANTSEIANAFLNAPWELLADDNGHWALQDNVTCCPIRRIGEPGQPLEPSQHRLMIVFMAAATRDQDNLNYEAEEAAIFRATREIGVDLIVEDTGTLDELGRRIATEARECPVDVVHLSCHGRLDPEPTLQLEDRLGNPSHTSPRKIARELSGVKQPRLIFLSACQTAAADQIITSAACTMVQTSTPAVLGWAGSVSDDQATAFAAALYKHLAESQTLEYAVATARTALNDFANEHQDNNNRHNDWHMARLILGPTGGDKLSNGNTTRKRLTSAGKTFLDAKSGCQVSVAGELEFVGRRHQLQNILRYFAAPTPPRDAGLIIHGFGRLGKSSLAARIAHRMPDHELVVAYRNYSLRDILQAIAQQTTIEGLANCIKNETTDNHQTLKNLLNNQCRQLHNKDGRTISKPLLLVIDDFEQTLIPGTTPTAPVGHLVDPNLVSDIRSLLQAFANSDTESRLLITSRFRFTLPDENNNDLAARLYECPLPPMPHHIRRRQAEAKRLVESERTGHEISDEPDRTNRVIESARGNPGLQDILYRMSLHAPDACDRCLDNIDACIAGHQIPDDEELRELLESLAIQGLLDLLTENEKELLRATTLFNLPIPRTVLDEVAQGTALDHDGRSIERIISLGLLEVHEDLYDPRNNNQALAISRLIRPRTDTLTESDARAIATVAIETLFNCWGGSESEGANDRNPILNLELTQLAILAAHAPTLTSAAPDAVGHLYHSNQPQAAAQLGQQAIGLLHTPDHHPPAKLLRHTAEALDQLGNVQAADDLLDRASNLPTATAEDRIHVAMRQSERLVAKGHIDEAADKLDKILPQCSLTEFPRERAMVMGQIADIKYQKGDLDEALRIRVEEQLPVFKKLGDVREYAITMGQIADIKYHKGDLDEALRIRVEEELPVYKKLGDVRSIAVTMGQIADIKYHKGDLDEALRIRVEEQLPVYKKLGDVRSIAVTMGNIADIKYQKGDLDEALELHQQRLPIFEQLQNPDGLAHTLWSIGRIQVKLGKTKDATESFAKAYQLAVNLGRLDAIAFIGIDHGKLAFLAGQRDHALQVLQTSHQGFTKLGLTQEAQQVTQLIAQLKQLPDAPEPPD